jgi:hypothetical protein
VIVAKSDLTYREPGILGPKEDYHVNYEKYVPVERSRFATPHKSAYRSCSPAFCGVNGGWRGSPARRRTATSHGSGCITFVARPLATPVSDPNLGPSRALFSL